MKEIESKAWVFEDDKKKVLEFLRTNAKSLNSGKIKKDTMYTKSSDGKNKPSVEFRLREENSESGGMLYSVTKKTRSYTESGTEVNNELEFFVDNPLEFHDFVLQLGFEVMYRKEKKVQQFFQEKKDYNILLEYVEMSGLPQNGDLLEIEIVCNQSTSDEEVVFFENSILDIFKELGLENQLEPKPYGKLLGQF